MPSSPVSTSFKGGVRLAKTLSKIKASLDDGRSVRIGFKAGARYPDGTLLLKVVLWNEFGTKTSPPRPAIRTMVAMKSPTWGKALAKILKSTKYNADLTMQLMGEGMASQLVESITNWTDPPNADSTIARKGFDKPWIETSFLIHNVAYQVTDLP